MTCQLLGQVQILGTVVDADDSSPIELSTIISNNENHTITDEFGKFDLIVDQIPVELQIQSLGYHEQILTVNSIPVEVKLKKDPLLMNTIIITDQQAKTELFTSINSITAIAELERKQVSGIADLLSAVPGVFIDGSLGEVYTRVFTRGVAASADEDNGWFYQSLQEDGMPISAVQYNYFSPDFFQRTDLTTKRLEAFRGGKSGILFQNAPGGAFNFISSSPSTASTEIKTTLGLLGEANAYAKLEAIVPFQISDQWSASIGGFYRRSDGHRNVDYTWDKGGQLKGILQGNLSNAVLTLRLKYLNDQVNRYTGLAAVNWENPEAAFGQNFNSTALMLPAISTTIPGQFGYDFDSSRGIKPTEFSIHPTVDFELGGWNFAVSSKWSAKSTEWNTSFASQRLGLESFLPYFLSGGQFPFGAVTFSEVETGQQIAVVDNSGALNAFQGFPPEFNYINGSLPNDALLGIAPWKKDDDLSEWMNQIRVSNTIGQHDFQFGLFHANSTLDYFTNASFAYVTFENEPRALSATLQDFEGNQLLLSDDVGLTNLGGLFFENGTFDVNQIALFANDQWSISDNWTIDAGLRYERVNHQGALVVPAPFESDGGLDGNPVTDFDNGQLVPSGLTENIDFDYNYVSYSIGTGYAINDQHFLFGRYSDTNKAPELNVYIQNFSGLPITDIGEVQGIRQFEIGYRFRSSRFSGSVTAFSSNLNNIAISDFVFDQQTNEIFNAPTQLNNTLTQGLELEWTANLYDRITITGSQTFQNSENRQFTVYDANGTADTSDDSILDFSGNTLAQIPSIMSRVSTTLNLGQFSSSVNWNFMGQREGNAENAFQLPAFHTFGLDVQYWLNTRLGLGLKVHNVFNSAGLMNFFGPNEFGSNANAATTEFIDANPDASFVVFPILPRAVYVSAHYRFE